MSDSPNKIYDPESVEMKMPEDTILTTDVTTKTIPAMPLVLFGLILILIGILGGLLWWGLQLLNDQSAAQVPTATRPTAEENNEPESTNAEAEVETSAVLSPSDELPAIENDLRGTSIETLDTELIAIDNLLSQ